MVTGDLQIRPGLVIPAAELEWSFSTSGGPGGQHANRSATRAELRFDLGGSPSIPERLRERMMERLGARVRGGVITVSADESRSQWRNRAIARERLGELLGEALRPAPVRRPTRPGRAAEERRIQEKRHRSRIKRLRKPPRRESW